MERLGCESLGVNGRQQGRTPRKEGHRPKMSRASCFPSRGGSSVWFLMASKLPPKPLNSQEPLADAG